MIPATMAEAHAAANATPATCHWYSSGCGRIELALTMDDAQHGHHSGQCDAGIADLMSVDYIREQLAAIPEDVAREVAAECGRNDYGRGPEDMSDHQANLAYVLWMACGDIVEEAAQ